jgi:hypothetical protein
MAIFTSRELLFLSSLRRDWQGLYQQELARLRRDDDATIDSQQPLPQPAKGFSMLRLSVIVAALTLIVAPDIGISPAKAVVCSEQVCISNCNRAGYKRCLRGCDRRIARRISDGICPWYGSSDWSLNVARDK